MYIHIHNMIHNAKKEILPNCYTALTTDDSLRITEKSLQYNKTYHKQKNVCMYAMLWCQFATAYGFSVVVSSDVLLLSEVAASPKRVLDFM